MALSSPGTISPRLSNLETKPGLVSCRHPYSPTALAMHLVLLPFIKQQHGLHAQHNTPQMLLLQAAAAAASCSSCSHS